MRTLPTATAVRNALVLTVLLSPLWAFEAAVVWGAWGEDLDLQPRWPAPPPRLQDALWVAEGETPDAGLELLWAGNFFQRPGTPGRGPLGLVARHLVYRDPRRQLRMLEHHVRVAAVSVWLSRHASEAELKQALAEWTWFGRDARGVRDAAWAYFGRPMEMLTVGQLALLAGLPRLATGLDRACRPEWVARRRTFVLERLRSTGVITAAEHEEAAKEELAVLPSPLGCPGSGDPAPDAGAR